MDLIYREQAMATIDELNAISFYEANEHSREAYKEIRAAIKQLPSAEKTGKWAKGCNIYDGELQLWFECSECDKRFDYRYNYCPNCGARMVPDEDKHRTL